MPDPLRELVLVGGGHSHVQVLRMHLMEPLEGLRVTVVVDQPLATYSGMVPAVVAGQIPPSDAVIDVRPLARRAGCQDYRWEVRQSRDLGRGLMTCLIGWPDEEGGVHVVDYPP